MNVIYLVAYWRREKGGRESDRVRAPAACTPTAVQTGAKFEMAIDATREQGISGFLAKY